MISKIIYKCHSSLTACPHKITEAYRLRIISRVSHTPFHRAYLPRPPRSISLPFRRADQLWLYVALPRYELRDLIFGFILPPQFHELMRSKEISRTHPPRAGDDGSPHK
jgi:hypothetical protein